MKHSSLIFSFNSISFVAISQVVNESDRRLRLAVPNRLRIVNVVSEDKPRKLAQTFSYIYIVED